jgi:hypothetical protein
VMQAQTINQVKAENTVYSCDLDQVWQL